MRKEYDLLVGGRLVRVKQGRGYKRVKVSLRTLPPFCLVTAPYGMSVKRVEAFLIDQEPWLVAHVKGNYVADVMRGGDVFRYGGVTYPLEYVEGDKFDINISGGRASITVPYGKRDAVSAYVNKFYAKELRHILDERIPYWEGVTGLHSSGYGIRLMSGRWGSCNVRTRKLMFNSYLASRDSEFIDYLVIHELGHIRYPDHGAAFKAYLTTYCPEWKEIAKR